MRARIWLERATLVAVLALCLAWRWVTPRDAEDLRPRPDAFEYEEAARTLRDGEGYCLVVEGGKYPPRFPFGFSALILPVLALRDPGPGAGVVVVIAAALLTSIAVWRLGRAIAPPVAAAAAALLAIAPTHVRLSRLVMSDVPSACLVTWLVVAIVAVRRAGGPPWAWAALGAAAGLAATVRNTNVFVLLPAAVAAIASAGSVRARITRATALGAGAVVGLLPMIMYGVLRFGDPLRSGYEVWIRSPILATRFAFAATPGVAGAAAEPNVLFYLRTLAGSGDLYSWPIALAIVVGCVHGWRRGGCARLVVQMTIALLVPVVAFHSLFFWHDPRYLLTPLPLLLIIAALPLAGGRSLRIVTVVLLLAGAGLLVRTPNLYAREDVVHEPTMLRALDRELPPDAALLVRTEEALFRRLLRRPGTDRVWVPLAFDDHQFAVRWNGLVPYAAASDDGAWIRRGGTPEDVERSVATLVAEGRPVYLSTLLSDKVPAMRAIIAALYRRFDLERAGHTLFRVSARP